MYNDNDIEIRLNAKELPFEYKWLEYRLVINQQLYDNKIIEYIVYKEMAESILARLEKIRNENKVDLTNEERGAMRV